MSGIISVTLTSNAMWMDFLHLFGAHDALLSILCRPVKVPSLYHTHRGVGRQLKIIGLDCYFLENKGMTNLNLWLILAP